MKKLTLLICLMLIAAPGFAQWQQTSLNNIAYSVEAIAAKVDTIYVWSSSYNMYLSTDDGITWITVNNGLPTSYNIQALVYSGSNIFAGSYIGMFLSTNNGGNWTSVNTGLTNTNILSIAARGDTVFAGTDGGGVFITTNNGISWQPVNTGLTNTIITALAIKDSNIFAGTGGGGIFLSTNNGQAWTAVNNGLPINSNISSLAIKDSNIFAGYFAGVYMSSNNGGLWTTTNNGLPNTAICAIAIRDSNIFAGSCSSDGVYISSNNGNSWAISGLGSFNIWSLAASDSTLFAGTEPGELYKISLSGNLVGTQEVSNNGCYINLYPNPFITSATLQLSKPLQYATLIFYDILGKEIKRMQNLSGKEITLQRDGMKSGMYFYSLTDRAGVIGQGKMVVE